MTNALVDASKAIPDEYRTGFLFGDDCGVFKFSVDPGDEIWLIIRIDDGDESVKYQFSECST